MVRRDCDVSSTWRKMFQYHTNVVFDSGEKLKVNVTLIKFCCRFTISCMCCNWFVVFCCKLLYILADLFSLSWRKALAQKKYQLKLRTRGVSIFLKKAKHFILETLFCFRLINLHQTICRASL